MSLALGQFVGRYRVDALVGRGGMGEVYRGWDPQLNRAVALKVMRDDLDEDEESKVEASSRFAREARMAARFVSAHFCAIFEVFEHDFMPVLVMEWLEGTTLRARIHDNTLSVEQRIEWITVLARGLAEAHGAGVVHRDFKPGNVLVTKDGALKIVDFGLAKRLRVASANANPTETSGFETKTGMILGTERYMAPEQAAGAGYDERADQFAWAIVAYELLSRTHPQNATPNAAFPMSPPRSLAELGIGVPLRISNAIARGLSLLPNDRFPSMNDMVVELEATDKEEAPSPPKTARMPVAATQEHQAGKPAPTAKKPAAKTTTFLLSAGVTLVVVATVLTIAFVVKRQPPAAHANANAHASAIGDDAAAAAPANVVVATSDATEDAAIAAAEPSSPPPSASASESASVRVAAVAATSAPAPRTPAPTRDGGSVVAVFNRSELSGRAPGARPISFGMSRAHQPAGSYEKAEVLGAVGAKKAEVNACYARPDFDGSDDQMFVRFEEIDNEGHPGKVVAGGAASSPPRHLACLQNVFRALKLPPPRGSERIVTFYINVTRN